MNIAILGYGKMGRAIEQLAIERGHKIVVKKDETAVSIDFKEADVAIDFSTPEAAFDNISQAILQHVPIVSGTTGWVHRMEEIVALCQKERGSFIYASNYSLGVNMFFSLNSYLAKLIQPYDYQVSIIETHHKEKLDAPSGTALTLAQKILSYSQLKGWSLDSKPDYLKITAHREDQVPGIHEVLYQSEVDDIMIKHTAHNRQGFALGAVIAAEFIYNKTGVFTMQDVLGLPKH